jgi:hypothetical protein
LEYPEQVKIYTDKELAKKEKQRLANLRIQQILKERQDEAQERRLDGEWTLDDNCPEIGLKAHALLINLSENFDVDIITNQDIGEIARIQVERIDASFRENIGYVFYYPLGSDKLTSTVFEGEVKINDVNHGLLRMSGGNETKLFEFKHDSNITILKNQNNNSYQPVVLSGQSVAIIRGDWYYNPQGASDDRSIFHFGSTGSTFIFDGADIYITSGSNDNYIFETNGLTNCRIEVRERTTTNGYIDPNDSIINYSFGVLEQGVPITPNKL